MKQVIFIIILICVFVFSACGKTDKSSTITSQILGSSNSSNSSSSSSSTGKRSEVGTELSTFMSNYLDAKTKLWDNMSKNLETEGNTQYLMGLLGFAIADMTIIEIPMYDTLLTGTNGMFKGKLMFSGIDAWKKVNGNTIEFGYDFTYDNEKNENKKGDHQVATGKFDIKDQSLTYENYTERNNEKINRYVVEIVANSDKSYSSQTLTDGSDNKLSGYFTWFDGTNIISSMAEKDKTDSNYKYSSILSKKNMKPEDMSVGLVVKLKASYLNGKATFESLEGN